MKEPISLRLDKSLLEYLRKEAEKDFRSVNNLIELILNNYKEQAATAKDGYLRITQEIIDIRKNLLPVFLSMPNDNDVLTAFEDLALYTITNFEIPDSHIDYITKALKIPYSKDKLILAEALKKNHKKKKGDFSIEMALRGIECYYSWGKPIISTSRFNEILKKVATLSNLVAIRSL